MAYKHRKLFLCAVVSFSFNSLNSTIRRVNVAAAGQNQLHLLALSVSVALENDAVGGAALYRNLSIEFVIQYLQIFVIIPELYLII